MKFTFQSGLIVMILPITMLFIFKNNTAPNKIPYLDLSIVNAIFDYSQIHHKNITNFSKPALWDDDSEIVSNTLLSTESYVTTCGEFPVTIEGGFPGAITYTWARADIGTTNFIDIPDLQNIFPLLDANSEGIYQLRGYDNTGTEVSGSPYDLAVYDVSDAITSVGYDIEEESFSGKYTITSKIVVSTTIETIGFDTIEYRLNRVLNNQIIEEYKPFQSSPVFSDVPPGDYYITARYMDCPDSEIISNLIMILGYPKYFTPNGDGFHDTWSLINIENQPSALIYIFDRYGKLLIQLRAGGPGWDGTYNGKNMPSSDYWFKVEFNEPTDPNMRNRVFAGNFSLIR